MGRLFHIINALKVFIGTIASILRRVLSSYYPFHNNNIFKKGLYNQGLERENRAGLSFSHRPESSGIVRAQMEAI